MDPVQCIIEIQQDARWKVSYGDLSVGTYASEGDANIVYVGILAAIGISTQPLRERIAELELSNQELQSQLDAINSAVAAGKHSEPASL